MNRFKKLFTPIIAGALLIVISEYVMVDSAAERYKLFVEVIKDLGVVVIGLSLVEIVWYLVGGAPTEIALEEILETSKTLNLELDAIQKSSAGTVAELKNAVKAISQFSSVVASSRRTGLVDVGESQDKLGYSPTRLARDIGHASDSIDLMGVVLDIIYSHDVVRDALRAKAKSGTPIRVLLASPENKFNAAIFDDTFNPDVENGSKRLIRELMSKPSRIELRVLSEKVVAMNMIRVDDYILVSPYLNAIQSTGAPRFAIKGSLSPFFQIYRKEFDKLFELAKPVQPTAPAPPISGADPASA